MSSNTRPRTFGDQIGASVQQTARGVAQGAGTAVELARLASQARGESPPARTDSIFARFTHSGPVAVSAVLSPAYEPPNRQTLLGARSRLAEAGSSTTTVTVYKNGSSIGSISWGSGETLSADTFDVGFSADTDLLQVMCTAAGTDAKGISIRFEFMR